MSNALLDRLSRFDLVAKTGRVQRILPTYVEADGPADPGSVGGGRARGAGAVVVVAGAEVAMEDVVVAMAGSIPASKLIVAQC